MHTHPCEDCRTPVDCGGCLERNYDGHPAVICTSYHRPDGLVEIVRCEACHEAREREQDAEACE